MISSHKSNKNKLVFLWKTKKFDIQLILYVWYGNLNKIYK